MIKLKSRRWLSIFSIILSVVMLSTCMMTGCTEDEADEFLNSIFGEGSYDTSGELTGDAHLKMHVIDVGQGDSILIQCGEHNVLIDCGENGMGETVLDYLDRAGVTHLDWLVATHPHSDHIGGMDTVLNSEITVDNMMMPRTSKSMTPTTKTYKDLLSAIKNKGLKVTQPNPGQTYDLDGVTMLVLSPKKNADYDDLNDYSVVLKFTYKDISIFTGGDANKKVEKELLQTAYDMSADIYKVSHHGGKESSCDEFVKAVNAKYSAISAGKDNKYGHPKQETLDRLNEINSQIKRTDIDGSIIYETDGMNIAVTTSK